MEERGERRREDQGGKRRGMRRRIKLSVCGSHNITIMEFFNLLMALSNSLITELTVEGEGDEGDINL